MPPELNNTSWIQSIVSNIEPMNTYIEVNDNQEVNYINKDQYELSYNNTLNKLNKKSKENIMDDNMLKKEMSIDNQIKELKQKQKENEKKEKEKIKKEKDLKKKLEQEEKELNKKLEKINKQKSLIQYKNQTEDNYLEMENEFNKTHFKVIKHSIYCNYDNFELICYKKGNFETSYSHEVYNSIDKEGNPTENNFIQKYMKSKTSRVYKDMNIYPNVKLCPPNHFNLWLPFQIEIEVIEERNEEGLKFILNHLLILCNNDKEITEYVIDWISHMFQRPYEKSTFLLFVSKEGIGKSTIFSKLLKSMIGVSKFFATTNPQNNILGEFNEALINAFLIVFEEMDFLSTKGCEGTFKALITNSEIYINPKGSKGYMANSFQRVCGNTNNVNINIPTKEGDRRKCMIKCSNEKKGDTKYMEQLHYCCEDKATMKSFYEYCMDRNVEDFISRPIPLTAYQEELQKYYESPVETFLKKKVCYFYHNENYNGVSIEYSFSKLYKDFNYWLCSNNEKISYTKRKFSLELGNLEVNGFEKIRKNGDIICIFNIPMLLEIWDIKLNNVDNELILLEEEDN
tara:strand:+ start:2739 stop:4448 length:1710 start_codon:yes stop_codon:yes gene_type:complete